MAVPWRALRLGNHWFSTDLISRNSITILTFIMISMDEGIGRWRWTVETMMVRHGDGIHDCLWKISKIEKREIVSVDIHHWIWFLCVSVETEKGGSPRFFVSVQNFISISSFYSLQSSARSPIPISGPG